MSEPFPIAYVAGSFPLRSETFVWREVRELRRRGWTVHTIGLRPPEDGVPKELRDLFDSTQYVYGEIFRGDDKPAGGWWRRSATTRLALRDALLPGEKTSARDRAKLVVQAAAGAALGRHLAGLGVRHVHAHFAHAPATVSMYAARAMRASFSFTGHANDLFQRRALLRRKLERAAFVACISEWHRELYRSIHAGGRYEVIRCGVPVEDYGPPPMPALGGLIRVLTVARLVEKKGIDTLIRSVADVPQARLTVAGDGPQRDALERLAAEVGGGRVAFLGPVDPSAVADLLREHDAFALPCRPSSDGDRDGIPVALMEAMAGSLPVLAGDLPAVRELVADGETGRLVPCGDVTAMPAAVAAILREWSRDAVARRVLGEAGRGRVVEEFGLGVNVGRLEAAFRETSA